MNNEKIMNNERNFDTMELNSVSSHALAKNGENAECLDENQYSSSIKSFSDNPMIFQDNNLSERMESNSILHSLSNLYAQLILISAGFMVLTEVLHSSVQKFYFHEYLFNFLICGGIICLSITYARAWSYRSQVFMTTESTENVNKSFFCFDYFESASSCGINKFYRIGTLIFGFGMLFSCGLEAISIFSMPKGCMYNINSIQPILRGLFTLLQIVFLFRNFQEIINTFGWFRHAAMMHLIATNLAVLIRILLWEGSKIWLDAKHTRHNSNISWENNNLNMTVHTLETGLESTSPLKHSLNHKIHFASHCFWSAEINQTESMMAFNLCLHNSTVGIIWEKIIPYMYPVIVQYCLSISGIIYLTWSNLHTKSLRMHFKSNFIQEQISKYSNTSSYAGSTKGLFIGLLIFIIGVIITILFFTLPKDNTLNMAFVVSTLQCVILSISSLAAVLGVFQLRKTANMPVQPEMLHVIFQKLGIFAVYSLGVCNAISGSNSNSGAKPVFVGGILLIVQAITQSLFLQQVLRKNLNSGDSNKKPKAQIVIMLAVINAVLWILDLFTTQDPVINKVQIDFFGNVAWPVIFKVLLPFVTFYRFHSAILLMEAWRKFYIV